jgi:hypothetical protein
MIKKREKKGVGIEKMIREMVKKIEEKEKEGKMKRGKGIIKKGKEDVIKALKKFYKRVMKKKKGEILNFLEEYLGYNRSYASYLLRHGDKVLVNVKGKKKRARVYDEEVKEALKKIWEVSDFICGKRLKPIIGAILQKLERYKEIEIGEEAKAKLKRISSATIDRLLKEEREKFRVKKKGKTKKGLLLKNQIPIRTYSEWDDKKVGFMEMDLVGHDGGEGAGEFAYTLNLTDIATGWMEFRAIKNRAQVWVH